MTKGESYDKGIRKNQYTGSYGDFKPRHVQSDGMRYPNDVLFIDEIHRLNKNQQEVLLPIMENFEAIIFGASTYNPYSSLTNAIRSRSIIFEFKALNKEELIEILENAVKKYNISINEDSKQ